MPASTRKLVAIGILATVIYCAPAHALRCGNKLILEGMLEAEVRAHCGEPASVQTIGLVLRYYQPGRRRGYNSLTIGRRAYGGYQELLVTEMLFNFGPHRLMRILRFEGGRFVDEETAGYGYRRTD